MFAVVSSFCWMTATRAQQSSQRYSPNPPVISVPDGELGQFRRSIMQFNHWTLICDEDIPAKQQVRNVTQSIVDIERRVIFSWSLVTSDNGELFFCLEHYQMQIERSL